MKESVYQSIGEFDDCFGMWEPQSEAQSKEPSLFKKLCDEIDQHSDSIMTSKFDKIAGQFLDDKFRDLQQISSFKKKKQVDLKSYLQINVKFDVLQVDSANLQQLPKYYQILQKKARNAEKNKIFTGDMTAFDGQVVSFNSRMTHLCYENSDTSILLYDIYSHLKKQYKKQATVYTSIFLVEQSFSVKNLQELQKAIREEMEFLLKCKDYHDVIIVIPATEQLLMNYQLEGLINKNYIFSDPKKMFIQLLLLLIVDTRIPLLSKKIYKDLIDQFALYSTNYDQQVHHLKLALNLYLSKCPDSLVKNIEKFLADKKVVSPVFQEYIEVRQQIKFGIDTIMGFIKNLSNQKQKQIKILNLKIKFFEVIIQDHSSFIQLNNIQADEITIKFILDEFIQSLKLTIPNCSEECGRIVLNVELGADSQNQQIRSRKNDREQMLLNHQQRYIQDKRKRLENQINKFIKEHIIDLLGGLESTKSEYIFYDSDTLQSHFSPDILNEYHVILYKQQEGIDPHSQNVLYTPYHQTRCLYSAIASQNINVKANDLQQEMPDYPEYQAEAFHQALGEMKLLGLIEDTKKIQLTVQKCYFAKQMFQSHKK